MTTRNALRYIGVGLTATWLWSASLSAGDACEFIRGDVIQLAGSAGTVDLNDGTTILGLLLTGNEGSLPESGCLDSADVNDNELVDLHDYIYLVDFRFNSGAPPSSPYPDPGTDTTDTTIPSEPDPRFSYALGTGAGGAGNTGISIPLTLTSEEPIRGLQVLLQYDPSLIRIDEMITEEGTLLSQESSEFIIASFDNTEGLAWIGVLKDFATPFWFHPGGGGDPDLPAGEDQLVSLLKCGIPVGAPKGTAAIDFVDDIVIPGPQRSERPAMNNLIVLADGVVRPGTTGGSIEIQTTFVRGDANFDTVVDISDSIYSLNRFFSGGMPFPCEDAADANNDADLDLSDSIWTLNFLFMGGPQPPEPYPQPGVDPSDDGSGSIGCEP